jgi:hypothetical protein
MEKVAGWLQDYTVQRLASDPVWKGVCRTPRIRRKRRGEETRETRARRNKIINAPGNHKIKLSRAKKLEGGREGVF